MDRSQSSRFRRQSETRQELRAVLGKSARRLFGTGVLAFAGIGLSQPALADITLDVGNGPVNVRVPTSYDGSTALPLVMLLHPLGTNGEITESYFHGITTLAEAQGFFLIAPDAPTSWAGIRYWKAMPWESSDALYLKNLIDAACDALVVDEQAIGVIGHSMGAVMGYRFASEYPERVSAVVSVSGAMVNPIVGGVPTGPVHVLEIHGTADDIIPYVGNFFTQGARATVMAWSGTAACAASAELAPDPLDLDIWLPGPETDVARWTSGCSPGGSGELWTINGGGHVPIPSASLSVEIVRWLSEHHGTAPGSGPLHGLSGRRRGR